MHDGLKRELIALLGNNGPALSLNDFRGKVKKFSRPRKWLPHSARKDGLCLASWRPQGTLSAIVPTEPQCSSELRRAVESGRAKWVMDSDWSVEETLYMMELWQDFDGRFVLMADRYDFRGRLRSVEEIKCHFYKCVQQSEDLKHSAIAKNIAGFNMQEALLRKTLLSSSLEKRTGDVEEADFLYSEYRRVLSFQEKMVEERNALQERLDMPVITNSGHCFSGSHGLSYLSHSLLVSDKLKRKRQNPQLHHEPPEKASNRIQYDNEVRKDKAVDTSLNTKYGIGKTTKPHSGCSLRSVRCQFKGNATPKLLSLLSSLGVASTVGMPTIETCNAFENLQRQLHLVLDAKKLLDKLNHECKTEFARQSLP